MKINTEITRVDYIEFSKFQHRKGPFKWSVIVGVVILIVAEIGLNYIRFDPKATIVTAVLYSLLYFTIMWSWLGRTGKIPDKDSSVFWKRELEFTEDVIIYSDKNSQGTSKWAAIKNLEESSTAYYLFFSKNSAIVIPKRSFKDEVEKLEFVNMVKRKISAHLEILS